MTGEKTSQLRENRRRNPRKKIGTRYLLKKTNWKLGLDESQVFFYIVTQKNFILTKIGKKILWYCQLEIDEPVGREDPHPGILLAVCKEDHPKYLGDCLL